MIHIYYGNTGNAMRALLALEECGLEYTEHLLDLVSGEHKKSEYLKINPMGQVPAIVDENGPGMQKRIYTQSGAILLYIAEKSGRYLPAAPHLRQLATQLIFAAIADINTLSRTVKYLSTIDDNPLAPKMTKDFSQLQKLAFRVMQDYLGNQEYLLGEFSVADIALYPVTRLRLQVIEKDPEFRPLLIWFKKMGERPAVQKIYSQF